MIYTISKKLFDFILFSSLFIAGCAAFLVYQYYNLILEKNINIHYLGFVIFSTISSYNFHLLLTKHPAKDTQLHQWSGKNKVLHKIMLAIGLSGSVFFFFNLLPYWIWLGAAGFMTFLYSSVKISWKPLQLLKKIAIAKTSFLGLVWTYVTTILPLIIEGHKWEGNAILFSLQQFFFIYCVCIIFDYRDKEADIADGTRSMITFLPDKGIHFLFYTSVLLSSFFLYLLYDAGLPLHNGIILLVPVLLIAGIYPVTRKNFSDYLYYFVVDGILLLPGLTLWIMNRF